MCGRRGHGVCSVSLFFCRDGPPTWSFSSSCVLYDAWKPASRPPANTTAEPPTVGPFTTSTFVCFMGGCVGMGVRGPACVYVYVHIGGRLAGLLLSKQNTNRRRPLIITSTRSRGGKQTHTSRECTSYCYMFTTYVYIARYIIIYTYTYVRLRHQHARVDVLEAELPVGTQGLARVLPPVRLGGKMCMY